MTEISVVENSYARPGKSKGRRRCQEKVTVDLGAGKSVTVVAAELSLEEFIELLEAAIVKARKAKHMRMSLKTFISHLQDQSEA